MLPGPGAAGAGAMSRHTSFHIGGPAALMALPKSREEAACAVRTAAGLGIAPFFMGNGSNLLAPTREWTAFLLNRCRAWRAAGAGDAAAGRSGQLPGQAGRLCPG